MQDIIATLPERVLNYKDYKGRTIIDWEFNPFKNLTPGDFFLVTRPQYLPTECKGDIQDAIDNRITRVIISADVSHPINSYEDDVSRLLDAGYIQALIVDGPLNFDGRQYHVDFMDNKYICENITSYYNYGMETEKTVVLRSPCGPITNNMISLGFCCTTPLLYPDTITSKFIANTNYTNIRSKHQDILDMLDAIKAKIEVL